MLNFDYNVNKDIETNINDNLWSQNIQLVNKFRKFMNYILAQKLNQFGGQNITTEDIESVTSSEDPFIDIGSYCIWVIPNINLLLKSKGSNKYVTDMSKEAYIDSVCSELKKIMSIDLSYEPKESDPDIGYVSVLDSRSIKRFVNYISNNMNNLMKIYNAINMIPLEFINIIG